MALGGGVFSAQNKILPGAYINFVSVANASAVLSERGIATIPLEMNWGPEGEVFTVTQEDFQKNSQEVFGYDYTAGELLPIREIFRHAQTVHFYRLNSGGEKAACTYATAKYPGVRGNDLRIAVEENENSTEEAKRYDVSTFLGAVRVDEQKEVASAAELKNNLYVDFVSDASLAPTVSTPLAGGANGTAENAAYQDYLNKMESYTFHAMGCPSADSAVTDLFVSYCKRLREEAGKKFQVVVFRNLADYEGVVSVKNGITDALQPPASAGLAVVGQSVAGGENGQDSPALVPWVTGVVAGTAVNKSASNMTYDGEYAIDTRYTQKELEECILEGSFVLHAVDSQVAVLEDLNTFVSATEEKSSDFSSNQVIRVLDQIANDIALLFGKKYIGKIPNDNSGRVSLWNDIVKHHQELQRIRAIENFSGDHVTVSPGETKKAVVVTDTITPVSAMSQLYMTVYVE